MLDYYWNKSYGIKRCASSLNTRRIDYMYQDLYEENTRLFLHDGGLTGSSNLTRIISEVKPDEIYNLGAQSHVAVSFELPELPELPEYTADVDAIGALRMLEAIRFFGLKQKKSLIKIQEG